MSKKSKYTGMYEVTIASGGGDRCLFRREVDVLDLSIYLSQWETNRTYINFSIVGRNF